MNNTRAELSLSKGIEVFSRQTADELRALQGNRQNLMLGLISMEISQECHDMTVS